jgi:hypothetical protein
MLGSGFSTRQRGKMTRALLLAPVLIVATFAGVVLVSSSTGVGGSLFGLTPATSCSVNVNAENGADNAVQSAINTYPGGTICVGAGSFPEQLTITNSHTVLKGAGETKTIIDPSALTLTLNTYDYDGGPTPAAAIIIVEGPSGDPTTGVTGVTIENLQVNGSAASSFFTGCGDDYFGVDFQASSGTLTSSEVTNISLPGSLYGCQPGLAVYAYNGWFNYAGTNHEPDSVTISHTILTAYDKNGITCDDPDETCAVMSDTVTGIGPTTLIADNGIQIAYGAYATVKSNDVTANGVYTGTNGCTGNNQSAYEDCSGNEGAGILLYDAATGTSVSSNTLSLNEYGIDSFADGNPSLGYSGPVSVTIYHNTVDSSTAYGIVVDGAPGGGDSATIMSNTVNDEASVNPTVHGAPGILVDTGTFTVTGNKILGSVASSGSSNGVTQAVCGPVDVFNYCPSFENITTAAIQGASESSSDLTVLDLSGNVYTQDTYSLATLGVTDGAVNVLQEA